ncbi:MAG TPA: hypothetical protein VHL53_03855 [Acidimicrobiia bacterium]|nr:hypothetical protein [Acidimicrobiia bacterium]
MARDSGRDDRPDTWSMLAAGFRQISRMDLDDLRRNLEQMARPSAAGMLESMGRTEPERVEKMAEMLRNSSEEEIAEMGRIFGLAMAKVAEERAAGPAPAEGRLPSERPRRQRTMSAAERRRQRRLAL